MVGETSKHQNIKTSKRQNVKTSKQKSKSRKIKKSKSQELTKETGHGRVSASSSSSYAQPTRGVAAPFLPFSDAMCSLIDIVMCSFIETPCAYSRPNGAKGCSHGWSEAQPVEESMKTFPAPEGRREFR
jgi:hypothetical protein